MKKCKFIQVTDLYEKLATFFLLYLINPWKLYANQILRYKNHCTRTHRIDGDYTLLYQNITCEYEMFLSKLGHYTFECVGSKSSIQNILPLERSSWWRHQMETFSALLAIFKGNSPVTSEFPHKGQWRGALMFSFIFVWKKVWVNNRDAGDLKHHHTDYDVTLMCQNSSGNNYWNAFETLYSIIWEQALLNTNES